MYPNEPDALAATESIVRNTSAKGATSLLQLLAGLVAWLLPWLYGLLHRGAFTALFLRPAERVSCSMLTVSDLIEEYQIRCAPHWRPALG
jgi:hypothetical protein